MGKFRSKLETKEQRTLICDVVKRELGAASLTVTGKQALHGYNVFNPE